MKEQDAGTDTDIERAISHIQEELDQREKNALTLNLEFVRQSLPQVVSDAERLSELTSRRGIGGYNARDVVFNLVAYAEFTTEEDEDQDLSFYEELEQRYFGEHVVQGKSYPLANLFVRVFWITTELGRLQTGGEPIYLREENPD